MDLFIGKQWGRGGGEERRSRAPEGSRVPPSLPHRGSLAGWRGLGVQLRSRAKSGAELVYLIWCWGRASALLPTCWGLPRHLAEKISGEGTCSALMFHPYRPGAGRMPEFGIRVAGLKGWFDCSIPHKKSGILLVVTRLSGCWRTFPHQGAVSPQ